MGLNTPQKKAVEYLEQVRADLPTASKMLIGEMFK